MKHDSMHWHVCKNHFLEECHNPDGRVYRDNTYHRQGAGCFDEDDEDIEF